MVNTKGLRTDLATDSIIEAQFEKRWFSQRLAT